MTTGRTRLILALFAVSAAFQADRALGGYIPVRATFSTLGTDVGVGIVDDQSLLGGASDQAMPPSPIENDEGEQPRLRELWDILPGQSGCGSGASSHATWNGSSNAMAAIGISDVRQPMLVGLLPDEMGPTFCNPPPWTLLRPPRQ